MMHSPELPPQSEETPLERPRGFSRRDFLGGAAAALTSASIEAKAAVRNQKTVRGISAEIGPERAKAFQEALERYDEKKINAAIAGLSGLPASRFESNGLKEIRVASDQDISERAKTDPLFKTASNAVNEDNRVTLRASAFTRPDGSVDADKVLGTLVHERCHGAASAANEKGESKRPWDAMTAHEFQEGVTELMAARVMRRLGHEKTDQAYNGGELMSAWCVERVVGTRALAEDFFGGKADTIRQILDLRLGPGAFKEITGSRFNEIMKLDSPKPEGLASLMAFARRARGAGIDLEAFEQQAEADGINERIRFFPDGVAVVLPEKETACAVVESEPMSKHSKPTQVYAVTNMAGNDRSRVGDLATNLKSQAEENEKIWRKLERPFLENGTPIGPKERALVDREVRRSYESIYGGGTVDLVINTYGEMPKTRDAGALAEWAIATARETRTAVLRELNVPSGEKKP